MADFATRAQLFQRSVDLLVQRGALRPPETRLTRAAAETPGTDVNILLAVASFMADSVTQASAQRFANLFLDSATPGDALERLVKDRFSPAVVVKEAQAAVVGLQFARQDTTAAITMNIGDKMATVSGVEFELTQAMGMGIGQSLSAVIPTVAVLPGPAGNVQAATVTEFVTAPPQLDLTVTNPEPGSGGRDRESAASLRDRAKDYYRAAPRGTLAAIAFGAATVQGVFSVNVTEEFDNTVSPPRQTGDVNVYLADSNGQSNTLLNNAVVQALQEYRAAGIYPAVAGGIARYEDIRFALATDPGFDPDRVTSQVAQAVVARVNSLKPGVNLLRSLLIKTASDIPGAVVSDTSLVTPATDLIAADSQIFKTDIARVTFQ